ncbi:MAG: hypothetical protein ACOYM7_03135 [Paludibacter sp.]
MKAVKIFAVAMVALVATTSSVKAQFSVGADVVSSYVWRGVPQEATKGVPNVQPFVSFTAGKFTVGSWASSSLVGNVKEVDLYATYAISSSLALTVTDYNWGFTAGNSYFNYGTGSDHLFEATLAYTGGESFPLSGSVNTFFAGANDLKADGKRAFSTYVELSYPLSANAKIFTGAALGESVAVYGTTGFGLINAGIKVSKSIEITDKFSLPVYGVFGVNPYAKGAYFVAGITL